MVSFHAHPDDECITCGGVMRAAADAGHRVVLVVATRGEHGEIVPGVLSDGETLAQRRVKETHDSAEVLGAERVEFLGYTDSGMVDTETNGEPGSFWSADVEEAAERLAAILREEDAEVLTVYDRIGGYGHPDHIQVHRVGRRAGELAGTPRVYEATSNRDDFRRMAEMAREAGEEMPDLDPEAFGSPESVLTTRVDVTPWLKAKRAAMRVHRSQIPEDSFFLALPDDRFAMAFGTEWFIRVGGDPAQREDTLFPA
ncbi:LmbE family N-acetylglucosaminyl deacetylase [Actinomycetospora succinea]|uniref:LmbE family N-acetylglucosaminyl deacetylase n=2 Tax=Actinomycetospora succinea TaxID=663603 RepID=A0A4R6VN99_9PSEU|nr:LmbE family N-acetylglucosaminyl deacetylase [Actinomycetospora succinea]